MTLAVTEAFAERFGGEPSFVVRAPGRVNLIGEHTDYNDGFVLPMAIDRRLWIAGRPRDDGRVELDSLDRPGRASFPIGGAGDQAGPPWAVYARAVADVLAEDGVAVRGIEGVVASEIPAGAGLSSSAALELGVARALIAAAGGEWDARRMALLCHRAETEGVGVACGAMDQLICALGRPGHALLIDCRSFDSTPITMPSDLTVVVLDTGTRRELSGSAFNDRRAQCAAAARALGMPSLREVASADLRPDALDDVSFRRARHVVTENERVWQLARALTDDDVARMGELMAASHASLRDDYEVSTRQLDAIVEIAVRSPGCVGARMTGAGFGGCGVALVRGGEHAAFTSAVAEEYAARTGRRAEIHPCAPAAGAEVVRP